MRSALILLVCFAACHVASGCGKSPYQKHEEIAKENIAIFKEYAEALESVEDRETARAAAARIEAASDRFEKLIERRKNLPKLTPADRNKLDRTYGPEMQDISKRTMKASLSAGEKYDGEESYVKALKRMRAIGENLKNTFEMP